MNIGTYKTVKKFEFTENKYFDKNLKCIFIID